eukprot:9921848-Ditylum_brightwellii.AAC.1
MPEAPVKNALLSSVEKDTRGVDDAVPEPVLVVLPEALALVPSVSLPLVIIEQYGSDKLISNEE